MISHAQVGPDARHVAAVSEHGDLLLFDISQLLQQHQVNYACWVVYVLFKYMPGFHLEIFTTGAKLDIKIFREGKNTLGGQKYFRKGSNNNTFVYWYVTVYA